MNAQPDACRKIASSQINDLLTEVIALSKEVGDVAASRLAPLRLDAVNQNIGEAPKSGKEMEALPPYFNDLRHGLMMIRANLHDTRDFIVRCEI